MIIKENSDDSIGNANIIQEISKIDNPLRIIGFRPTLSDNEPVIGEKSI